MRRNHKNLSYKPTCVTANKVYENLDFCINTITSFVYDAHLEIELYKYRLQIMTSNLGPDSNYCKSCERREIASCQQRRRRLEKFIKSTPRIQSKRRQKRK